MKKNKLYFFLIFLFVLSIVILAFKEQPSEENNFVTCIIDPKKQEVGLYWKDGQDKIFRSIANLKNWIETKNQSLVFAMNAGMYETNNAPLGLFIQNYKTIRPLNTRSATGNFYLKPNGVFYLDKYNHAGISATQNFSNTRNIKFATQSGPMLVINGKIHSSFKEGSVNLNIRNGVGILPDNHLLFAMSKQPVNFYDFAMYFKKAGCSSALYLDGFVCRTYLPSKNWVQTDGDFGVIIAVTTPQ